MKRKDVIYSKKEFLNLPGQETIASILTDIIRSEWHEITETERMVDYNLIITDCSEIVKLTISSDGEYDRENSLYKLDTLISTLTKFKEAVQAEFLIQVEVEKKRKEKEEKEKKRKKVKEKKLKQIIKD
jgi:hypothetical protein